MFSTQAWATLAGIIIIIFSVLIWSFLGTIPIKVEGRGIIISSQGLFSVQSRVKGVVMQLHATAGEFVPSGTLIAELTDQEKVIERENTRTKLEKLKNDYAQLKEEISREDEASTLASQKDLSAKEFTVAQLQNDIVKTEKDIATKKKLVEEGLISKSILDAAEDRYYSKKIELETTQATIANIKANMVKGYRTEELKSKEQELNKVKDELEILESTLNSMKIYTPVSGRVLDWLINKGDLVNPGTSLVWMELAEKDKESAQVVLGYLPIENGKKVQVGDQVEIEVSTVNVQEFGYILGHVHEISQYATSKQNIANVIKNEGLAEYLTNGNEVVIQVFIEPVLNPKNPSGYQWSSGEGPPVKISTGTICLLRTIVERVRPFYYVLPIWRLKSISPHFDSKSSSEET